MYDTQTKNKSFINMWRYLQDKNIENCMFMLELKDESLQGFTVDDLKIDDKHEKAVIMQKVYNECKNNIWFFFRELIKVPNVIGNSLGLNDFDSMFILTPETMRMIYLYQKGISFFKDKEEHKVGSTTTLQLLYLYERFILDNMRDLFFVDDNDYVYDKYKECLNKIINSNFSMFPVMDEERVTNWILLGNNILDNTEHQLKNGASFGYVIKNQMQTLLSLLNNAVTYNKTIHIVSEISLKQINFIGITGNYQTYLNSMITDNLFLSGIQDETIYNYHYDGNKIIKI